MCLARPISIGKLQSFVEVITAKFANPQYIGIIMHYIIEMSQMWKTTLKFLHNAIAHSGNGHPALERRTFNCKDGKGRGANGSRAEGSRPHGRQGN